MESEFSSKDSALARLAVVNMRVANMYDYSAPSI